MCPAFKLPQNGHSNTSVAVYDTYMNVSCDPGYYFPQATSDQSSQWIVVRCQANSTWSQNVTDCKGKNKHKN